MKNEIIMDMLAGRIDPYVVASSKVSAGLVSIASVKSVDHDIRQFVATGVFSSKELDNTYLLSDGSNLKKIAERIARFNYYSASLITTDKEILATIGFTLFQIMAYSYENIDEKQQLFESYYDIIKVRNLGAGAFFHIHYIATTIYYELTSTNSAYYDQVLQYGLMALDNAKTANNQNSWHYFDAMHKVGVALNETAGDNPERIKESVALLKRCLNMTDYCKEQTRGSVLNSLGYALRRLGELKQDKSIIQEAIDAFNEALPLRVGEREVNRTEGNIELAQKLLNNQSINYTISDKEFITNKINAATRTFGEIMASNRSESDITSLLRKGMDYLLDFSITPQLADNPYLQARSELAIGIGLVFNGDSAGAICFLKAALRKFQQIRTSDQMPRITAATYNLGLAFANLKGLRSENYYSATAIKHFSNAKEMFLEMNQMERAKVCEHYIEKLSEAS